MSAEALCRRITQFGFYLLEADLALDARQHVVQALPAKRKSIIWTRNGQESFMTDIPARLRDYLSLLGSLDYSYIMHDGAIIQIAFTYSGNKIERHRLAYHPCPFRLDKQDLDNFDGGLLELIEMSYLDRLEETLFLRSPIRFDYAPDAQGQLHPASHLTVNDPSCRIPAKSPLSFDTFVKFIFENFYIDIWNDPHIVRHLSFIQEPACLSDSDVRRAHLNWAHI